MILLELSNFEDCGKVVGYTITVRKKLDLPRKYLLVVC